MNRRKALVSLGSLVFAPGCVSDGSEETTETESDTTTDDCGWPQFCDGSKMVEVTVNTGFSGEVVLKPGCRDEDIEIQPGETKALTRQVDAEECAITLYVDGEEVYHDTIQDYESTTLRVGSSGEVTAETIEL
ncbi:hypothetical protein E6P09_03885 [Haloferax mediterranei ATCC 33500]|uniref:Uncharacterized protein n=1 Tax=Haloferax mediterranei (strain ATCC 33500 / DSM 1411 / JCM 8866 / NBRC 14739 / NCIMB 2177 / R-4) TaxID=523841 RepID=I3R0Y8_HALMT|nr:hypothetical protein [Haloferax mediterranei]AFK17898.1 hypothetical protein HFX_0157 [Haloferax mediterranei ATCC 33500]AHZ22678.1 hypothetical protein BM92_08480 [Haloferax mediterranei ATCC 33500]EMA02827.1 hypothetical protein C439_09600 [Haloferax mediterranei ATCC 33500]MDX5987989.1 hypothetical protein [Haloferax mediterranei ATCC 33500]QCQ74456.1 hypothetical protein E6P09_03885 [Haloferax mediterranei ATCC 33500]